MMNRRRRTFNVAHLATCNRTVVWARVEQLRMALQTAPRRRPGDGDVAGLRRGRDVVTLCGSAATAAGATLDPAARACSRAG